MSFWFSVLGGLVLEAVLLGLAGFAAYRVGCALAPDPGDLLERIVFSGLVGVTGWVAPLQVLGLIGVLWLPVQRDQLAGFLKDRGIMVQSPYLPLHQMSVFKGNKKEKFPVSDWYSANALHLPLHSFMSQEKARMVVACCRSFFSGSI